ncbi:hypothetical protein PSE_1343 [Pseudovibrio sp. FO-BEG1]|nr:hypothetical protein PSE_1343 [Pseudovibrio sp. FO-BEG1]
MEENSLTAQTRTAPHGIPCSGAAEISRKPGWARRQTTPAQYK